MSTQTFNSKSRPKRAARTAYRSIDDEGGMVVLPGRAEIKILNPAGTKIFSLLDGTHSIDGIAAEITEEFEVTSEQALDDVMAFVLELSEHGMLEGE